MDAYELGGIIGRGSFSIVRQATVRATGASVAIKLVTPETDEDTKDHVDGDCEDRVLSYNRQRIDREVAYWRHLSHPNLCRLLEVIDTERQFAFVMEFAEGGDLLAFLLDSNQRRSLSLTLARRYIGQLVAAVAHLHANNLVHGDIKLENILLCDWREAVYDRVVLGDFGLMRRPSLDAPLNCGTIEYAAPELISAEASASDPFKTDVWALGVVLFAILFHHLPYDAPNAKILKARILATELVFPELSAQEGGEAAMDLLRLLLQKNPEMRPTIQQIAQHPFVSGQER